MFKNIRKRIILMMKTDFNLFLENKIENYDFLKKCS